MATFDPAELFKKKEPDLTLIDWLDQTPQTFEELPFCEVDAFVLSCCSYLMLENWEGSRGEMPRKIKDLIIPFTREKVADLFWFDGIAVAFAKSLVCSGRYHELAVSDVVSEVDADGLTQFSAMCFHVPDGSLFLSFRGTDNTVAGWEEDLCLTILDPVPSQDLARRYVERIVSREVKRDACAELEQSLPKVQRGRHARMEVDLGEEESVRAVGPCHGTIRLGGHSKGGNLAFFAAIACDKDVQDRITMAYNFDGPGFGAQRLSSEGARRVRERSRKFIPVMSVFGRALDDLVDPEVVASAEIGLMQHMPFSWKIRDNALVREQAPDPLSDFTDKTTGEWLDGMTLEERQEFLAVLFGVLDYVSSDGSVTTLPQDLMNKGPQLLAQLPRIDKASFKVLVGVLQRMAWPDSGRRSETKK